MTKADWLSVAMIIAVMITAIATALGPIAAALIQSRINQPKPTPDVNQPANRIYRIRLWLARHIRKFCLISILFSFCALIWMLTRPSPIGRTDVFTIALIVSNILYNIQVIRLRDTIDLVWKIEDQLIALSKDSKAMANTVDKLIDIVEPLSSSLPNNPQRAAIGSIKAELKKLSDE